MANIKGNVLDAPEIGTPESDDLLVRAANMNIHRYVPTEKPGVYDDEVDTLIKVDAESGYQNSIEVLVPADQVKKHKRYFTKSAASRNMTARIVNGEEGVRQGDGGALLEFVLRPKVHRRKKADDAAENTADDAPEKEDVA